jgi:hypothetical protein
MPDKATGNRADFRSSGSYRHRFGGPGCLKLKLGHHRQMTGHAIRAMVAGGAAAIAFRDRTDWRAGATDGG